MKEFTELWDNLFSIQISNSEYEQKLRNGWNKEELRRRPHGEAKRHLKEIMEKAKKVRTGYETTSCRGFTNKFIYWK